MQNSGDKALVYIGAFIDTMPIVLFREIKKFIFIDQAPEDADEHWGPKTFGYSICQTFVASLEKGLQRQAVTIKDFQLIPDENTMRFEFADGRVLLYFYNTDYPKGLTEKMRTELQPANILYIKGYTPDIRSIRKLKNIEKVYITKLCLESYDRKSFKESGNFKEVTIIKECDYDSETDSVTVTDNGVHFEISVQDVTKTLIFEKVLTAAADIPR